MKRQFGHILLMFTLVIIAAASLTFVLSASAQTPTPMRRTPIPTATLFRRTLAPTPTPILRLQIQPISNFTATPSTTRGQVRLSWNYSGSAFRGYFVVERSNNQMAWSPVSACRLPYSYGKTTYSCTDSGLVSRRTYYYRLCTSTGTTCAGTVLTATVTAR